MDFKSHYPHQEALLLKWRLLPNELLIAAPARPIRVTARFISFFDPIYPKTYPTRLTPPGAGVWMGYFLDKSICKAHGMCGDSYQNFTSSVKSNYSALRLAFLLGVLAYVGYVAVWINWSQFVPRAPLFGFFVGAYPWSMAWSNWQSGLVGTLPWPVRDVISTAVIGFGFGFNCALILAIIRFIRSPTHNTSVEKDASPQSGSHPSL